MNSILKQNVEQLREVFVCLFPRNKIEIAILIGLFLFYISYSIFIAVETSAIDDFFVWTDAYFSFDTGQVYYQGYPSMPPHPLMRFITAPFFFVANSLAILFGTYKAKTVFLVVLCSYLVSMSSVFVFRYLREIVDLKKGISYLLTLMFATTSTCLVLCFSPESYTISLFLLTFTIYYYSYCIKQERNVTLLSNLSLVTLLGGITVTNFAMGIIPMFFTKQKLRSVIKKILIIGCFWLVIMLWLELEYNFYSDARVRLYYFTYPRGQYYEHAIDLFFGAAVFFPEVISHYSTTFNKNMYVIVTEFYQHWWQYAFVGILAALLLYSIIRNYKNKYVQIITLYFGVSVFIHLIVKYGIDEPMIFGGHWVYIVPLLLGWLYKSLQGNHKKICFGVISLLFISLLLNNFVEMNHFVEAALRIFPVYPTT